MSGAAIAVRGVAKRFARAAALRDLDLDVAPGASLAVVGPNGAGKSTLLRLLAGLARPSAGRIEIDGRPPTHRSARAGLGYLGHATLLAPSLTVRENLIFAARLYGVAAPRARADERLASEGLEALADRPVGALSRGQAQRVAIARALVHAPALVLLDEPFTGLDRGAAQRLAARLAELRAHGHTSVLVTHSLEHVRELADQALVLSAGRAAWRGRLDARSDELERALASALEDPGVRGMSVLFAILWKDLVTEWRSRDRAVAMGLFAMLVVAVFEFALPEGANERERELAPALLWVTYVFAALLGLGRAFALELENDALSALALAPSDRGWVFLGKAVANFLILSAVQVLVAVVFALFFNLDWRPVAVPLAGVTALASIGLCSAGTLFGAVAVRTRFREVMLPLLILPLLVPVISGAVRATGALFETGAAPFEPIQLLIVTDVAYLVLGFVGFEYVLDE